MKFTTSTASLAISASASLMCFASTIVAATAATGQEFVFKFESDDNSSSSGVLELDSILKPHSMGRSKRQTLTGASNGINVIGSGWGSVIKLLEMPGKCCKPVTHDYCGDGSKKKFNQCCGYGRCNIGCCNCDDGCRIPSPAGSAAVAIVFHHKYGKGSNKAFPILKGECWNMEWWNDKISDVMAIGCVTVWEHGGCAGASKNIVGRISKLEDVPMNERQSWDDQISSLSFCGGIDKPSTFFKELLG